MKQSIIKLGMALITGSVMAGTHAAAPVSVVAARQQGIVRINASTYVLLDIYIRQGGTPLFEVLTTNGLGLYTADDLRTYWDVLKYEVPAVNLLDAHQAYGLYRNQPEIGIY